MVLQRDAPPAEFGNSALRMYPAIKSTLVYPLRKDPTLRFSPLQIMSLSACLRALPVLFGILYLIADANNIDFDYAWDHSVYPPFTGAGSYEA